ADIERMRQVRPGFCPGGVGLHWPSLPWGDEELSAEAMSFAATATAPDQLIDAYAARIADTPTARAALHTIFEAAAEDVAPDTLPGPVRDAYAVLDREAGLGSAGEGAAPGDDREPFDAEQRYQEAQEEAFAFGASDYLGGLLGPLRQ